MIRIPRLTQWDCVRIHWSDPAALPGEWVKVTTKNMHVSGCITVGQVYEVHTDRLTVACTWDPTNKNANGGMTIPFVLMDRIEILARAKDGA